MADFLVRAGAGARAQADGLADVERVAVGVAEDVDARILGERGEVGALLSAFNSMTRALELGRRELLEQSIGIAKQLGTTTLLAWGQGLLATCLLALGEHASLLPLCEETIRLAAETHDRLARSLAHRTLAEALAVIEPSEVDRAERAILDAIHTQRELGARPELARSYVVYTRLLLRWARAEEAAKYRSEAIAMFRSMRMSRDLAAIEREESAPI